MRTGHEAGAPEGDAAREATGIGLEAHTVDRHDGKAVGYGVSALYGGPCLTLALLLVGSVGEGIADGGGVDEQVGTLEGHQTRCLGIPLIPADEHAEATDGGVDGLETEVAGREIEFLVVGGIIRDVHLAVFAGDGAVLVQHYGRVVVQAGSTALEERGDDHHAQLLGQGTKTLGRRTGDGLGLVEEVHVLGLTEVEAVVKFLKDDQFCSLMGQVSDLGTETLDIALDVGSIVLLNDTCFHVMEF